MFGLSSILTNDYENNSGNANPNPNPAGNDRRDNVGDDGTVEKSVDDNNDVGEKINSTADKVNDVDIDNSGGYTYNCSDDDSDDDYNDDIDTNDVG